MIKRLLAIIAVLAVTLSAVGCAKKENSGDDANLIESEGNVEITVPDDQESGGE